MLVCRAKLLLRHLQSERFYSTSTKNFYELLNVPKTASTQEIKEAFYELSKKNHPDILGTESEYFLEIKEAYETLKNETKRQAYDFRNEYDFSSPSFDEKMRTRRRSYEYQPGESLSQIEHEANYYETVDLSAKYGHFYDPNLEVHMAKRERRLVIAAVFLVLGIIGLNILYVHYLMNEKMTTK